MAAKERHEWTTTELLLLAHAVQKFGDNAWAHVAKVFAEMDFDGDGNRRNLLFFTGKVRISS